MYSLLLKTIFMLFLPWNGTFFGVMADCDEFEDYIDYDCTYAPTGPTTPYPVETSFSSAALLGIPSFVPSALISVQPSTKLSAEPNDVPIITTVPSESLSSKHNDAPSTSVPSALPSAAISTTPTSERSSSPSSTFSAEPIIAISNAPTADQSNAPSSDSSGEPSNTPTVCPQAASSEEPNESSVSSQVLTEIPSESSSEVPLEKPSNAPNLSTVENESVTPTGTTAEELEDNMESQLNRLVHSQGRALNSRDDRSLNEGTCQVNVIAQKFACPLTITDRTLVCFEVVTIIQEPQPGQGGATSCDVNVGAEFVGDGLTNNLIDSAGIVVPGSIIITLATEEPSSQQSLSTDLKSSSKLCTK